MKCPVCVTPDLLMTERQSIEIGYCPTCRGVWLERGELDRLIARADDDAAERRRDAARGAARAATRRPRATSAAIRRNISTAGTGRPTTRDARRDLI